MKSVRSVLLILLFTGSGFLKAQVWYPEGVYTQAAPALISADNSQLLTIGRTAADNFNSYWQVCVFDGKSWLKLPVLTLNKTAEVLEIKKYFGQIYIGGNFSFDNGNHYALVRYNTERWEGLGQFKKAGSIPGVVHSMDVQNAQLIVGGLFLTVNGDTMPNLIRYNSIKFSPYFTNCKSCEPDNAVFDVCSNDSTVAICGAFTRIMNRKSKYLLRIGNKGADTFMNSPRVLDKVALNGEQMFAVGGLYKDKRIYHAGSTFTEINKNLDSAIQISELLVFEGRPVLCGQFAMNAGKSRPFILSFENNTEWKDIGNNFKNPQHIAAGRNFLFVAGHSPVPLSIWNPNRFVARFYPGLALVKANVFLDANNNCIQEPGEKPLSRQYIKLPFLNRGVFTSEKGLAEFLVPNAGGPTLRFVVKPWRNIVRSNCADTAVSKTFTPGNYSDSIQFPLARIPNVNDIRLSVSSPRGRQVIKNSKVLYYIQYENVGSNAISGNISLKKNPKFTKEQTIPAFDVQKNDSVLLWNYSNLQAGEKRTIVYAAYPEDAYFDKQVQFDVKVTSDITSGSSPYTSDDTDSLPQQTEQNVSAFRKEVFPKPQAGDSITYLDDTERDLRYHIAFNNFTADTVFYAVVIDTLDLNLDMSFIEETGSDKAYYTEVQTDPNNAYKGILIWHFPDIKLLPNPSKNYEITGSGSYIGFKVVSKPLSAGYYIKNTASVFYDNRFAGNTNAVYCTLASTGIADIFNTAAALSVYPNPFNDWIEIQSSLQAGERISLLDASGREVYSSVCSESGENHRLDMGGLAPGIYVLQVSGNTGIRAVKLMRN